MTIVVEFSSSKSLVISLEYGGAVLYNVTEAASGEKFHLKLDFADGSELAIRLKSMGAILMFPSGELDKSCTYKRDFSTGLSPLEADFTFERFSDTLSRANKTMKALLVRKEAMVVGYATDA